MGVMFDIKVLGYKQVFNPVNDLYVGKDERRKRRHKESQTRLIKQKHKKYPYKGGIRSDCLINSCINA